VSVFLRINTAAVFCAAVTSSAKLVQSTGVQSTPDVESTPSHWEYYRGSVEDSILRMYRSPLPVISPSSSYRALMLVRAFMNRTWRNTRVSFDIISVRQVENPLLYRRYITRRREIALAAQGRRQPIGELRSLPDEKDFATNVHGKCHLLNCRLLLSSGILEFYHDHILDISVVTVAGICNLVGGGVFFDMPPRWWVYCQG